MDVFKALVLLQARPILGTFTFSGATLRVGGQLTVDAHGAIAGNGILDAPNRNVVNGGFITPGLSPGKLIIQGNYEQLPAGTLLIEIAGLNQGQFDLLEVSGNTVLDGTLELRFLDGFLPKKDDIVAFLHVDGAVSGNFSRVAFPQLAPGFNATLNVSPDGSVRLTALANAVAGTGTAIISPTLTGNVAPHLNQVSITADQVVLSWTTTAGRNYQIEAKGNVKEASWSPLGPTVRAEGSLLTMQLSASGAERYYRVSEKP